ncbi:MAG: hypothetical protein ACI8RD_004988 [Bacillariaceae sp.]|jgi:hypothetical protein
MQQYYSIRCSYPVLLLAFNSNSKIIQLIQHQAVAKLKMMIMSPIADYCRFFFSFFCSSLHFSQILARIPPRTSINPPYHIVPQNLWRVGETYTVRSYSLHDITQQHETETPICRSTKILSFLHSYCQVIIVCNFRYSGETLDVTNDI